MKRITIGACLIYNILPETSVEASPVAEATGGVSAVGALRVVGKKYSFNN
jgi:hypothetical protein